MFYLRDIFKLIVDGFNKSSFAKHNFVCHGHKRVLHVVFNFGYELDSVREQELKQLPSDISFISTEFAFDILDERFRIK